jgi:hypothetical protein
LQIIHIRFLDPIRDAYSIANGGRCPRGSARRER